MSDPGSQTKLKAKPRRDGDSAPASDPYAQIVGFARSTSSRTQYLAKVLRCLTLHFASPYAALHVRFASEVLQDDFHSGPTDPKFWKASVQTFLTDSLGVGKSRAKLLTARSGSAKVAFVSAPIVDPAGGTVGALALVLAPVNDGEVTGRLVMVEALVRFASACLALLGQKEGESSPGGGRGSKAATAAMARVGRFNSAEELAFSITNDLRNKLGCEQVSLGLVVRNRVHLMSISGLDDVNRRSPGVLSLVAAMEECLDANDIVSFQRNAGSSDETDGTRFRVHMQWHAAAGGDAVASLPLRIADVPIAVLSLRDRGDQPLTSDKLETIRTHVEPYAQALLLARRASRNFVQHARDVVHESVRSALSPGRYGRKLALVAAVSVVLIAAFGSTSYRLTVPCAVTAASVRHVAAPFDGILTAASVIEGDRVRRGDVLCELDRRELDWQLEELDAQLAVLEREKDRAMAADVPVEVQLALAKQHQATAKRAIILRRADQAAVRAPIDGVVVAGDLRRMIGSVVARGQPLFEVAPLTEWQLEMDVPESMAADVELDLAGVFVSFAHPGRVRSFRIARIQPTAQTRDGRNVFVAEARIAAEADGIRPGMEGIAKIHVGDRPIWWVAFHRAIDYVRMTLWL